MIRVLALGLVAVALAAFAGYRLGISHAHSRPAVLLRNDVAVVPIPSGNPSGEGFGAGSIWVPIWSSAVGDTPQPGYVARYDPATRRLLTKLRVGSEPLAVQPGFGSMWVTNSGDGTVTRIDPGNDALSQPIKVGPVPYQMAPAGGGMWVATQTAAVKIDPSTNRVVLRTPFPHPPNTELPNLAGVGLDADSHGVWVSTALGTVLRLDPTDGRIVATIPVQKAPHSSPGMVAIEGDNVWVSNYAIKGGKGPGAGTEVYGPSNHVVDISATTNKIVARVATAGYVPESFLPRDNNLLIVGVDYQKRTSALISTDWPYKTLNYVRPLGGSSFNVVDTHGHLWVPSWFDRTLQILPESDR